MARLTVDWNQIKERITDDTMVVLGNSRAIHIVLSVFQSLHWRAIYRDTVPNNEWDTVEGILDDFEGELGQAMPLSTLISYIDEVEALLTSIRDLQAQTGCCGNTAPTSQTMTTALVPGGTPPATWGDGETVADADDWNELICGAAHSYVDQLASMGSQLNALVGTAALVVGAIAGILGLLSGAGILLAVAYGTAATVVGGLISGATQLTFAGTADDIEAARDSIVCSVLTGGSGAALAAAVENALGSDASWTIFYQWVDYDSAWATMVTGNNPAGNLPVNRRDDCICSGIPAGYQVLPWDVISGPHSWSGNDITINNAANACYTNCQWTLTDPTGTYTNAQVVGYIAKVTSWLCTLDLGGDVTNQLSIGYSGYLVLDYPHTTPFGQFLIETAHDGVQWDTYRAIHGLTNTQTAADLGGASPGLLLDAVVGSSNNYHLTTTIETYIIVNA